MKVVNDKVISIEYTLLGQNGRVIDSTDNRDPVSFIQGRGSVFPALEQKLEGQPLGAKLEFTLAPEEAFGAHDPQRVQRISRARFHQAATIAPGMEYKTIQDDEEQVVTVVAVDEDHVTVDANHPLAGEALTFKVVIVGVRDAIDEELRTGEVQEIAEIYAKEQGAHPA